ncbi:MAG: hypothetical protein HY318_12295 [Armatimonadetes bacterium]|nr:hypothetical protein [Armatimonadota bacterium]
MSKVVPTPRETASTPSRMPLMMPDDFSDLNLVAWRVEQGELDPENPLIEGEMPWDRGGVGVHSSVLQDPINGKWKAYVVCTEPEEFPENQPENTKPWASENAATRRICLFESEDGVHWTRPELDNVQFGGYDKTNIIFDLVHGTSGYSSIMIDPENAEWPYEMVALREHWCPAVHGMPPEGNGYYRYRSRDGRKWEQIGGKLGGPMIGDLCFIYRVGGALTPFPVLPGEEPPAVKYVSYYRLGAERQATDHVPVYEDCPRRSCYHATSPDGETWTRDENMLLTADERDHRDTQYQECIPLKVPGGYIATVTMYLPISQTLDIRFAASRDGSRWWFPDRTPCLPNPPIGDYGGGMIWQSQYLQVIDGRLYTYFGGTEGLHRQLSDTRAPSVEVNYLDSVIDHGAHFLPFNSALCRASWTFDRLYALVSSAGGPTVGMAVTQPADLAGKTLRVNLTTRPAKKSSKPGRNEGYMQVEVLDAQGDPLPGFARDDCPPLRGDHRALWVKWTGGDKAPKGAKKVRFYLKRAFLYGFVFDNQEA